MKLRIEGNSIRLRLRKSEVSKLASTGRVAGETRIPGGNFHYALELHPDISDLTAKRTAGGITLLLPETQGKSWAENQQVGFEAAMALEDNESLHLLVEKDFVCLDRDPALQEDQYPNPKSL
ncbi:DUF7009 family protein [Robiginitalea myxolifaciens]|nr:hypothetical protein [Robiginitalea myxolifaciens]